MVETSKPLCFVIGPIGLEGSIIRKHSDLLLNSIIKNVLENGDFDYRVKRADEDSDPGMIGERMISDIINAELVIADLTELNANAFYELGIRHAAQKPVIHVARTGTALPFDNVHHRTLFVDLSDWHSSQNCRQNLAASAKAIEEPGYRVSNPITQAYSSFQMRSSGDSSQQLVADLRERLSYIERQLKLFNNQKTDTETDDQYNFEEGNYVDFRIEGEDFRIIYSINRKLRDAIGVIETAKERAIDYSDAKWRIIDKKSGSTRFISSIDIGDSTFSELGITRDTLVEGPN